MPFPSFFPAIACCFLAMLASNVYDCDEGWPRNWMTGLFGVVVFFALAAILPAFAAPLLSRLWAVLAILLALVARLLFWLIVIVGEFLAVYLASGTVRK